MLKRSDWDPSASQSSVMDPEPAHLPARESVPFYHDPCCSWPMTLPNYVLEKPRLPELASSLEQEVALYRKVDLRVMPILALLFFLNFLDRGTYSMPDYGA